MCSTYGQHEWSNDATGKINFRTHPNATSKPIQIQASNMPLGQACLGNFFTAGETVQVWIQREFSLLIIKYSQRIKSKKKTLAVSIHFMCITNNCHCRRTVLDFQERNTTGCKMQKPRTVVPLLPSN